MTRAIGCATALLLAVCTSAYAASPREQRLRLHMEQQQDALNLQLQQSIGRRADLSTRDAVAIDRLQMRQRMERQLLDHQQLVEAHALVSRPTRSADTRHHELESQRAGFAMERQLQTQRFELDQQRLLQSIERAPLQRAPGTLELP